MSSACFSTQVGLCLVHFISQSRTHMGRTIRGPIFSFIFHQVHLVYHIIFPLNLDFGISIWMNLTITWFHIPQGLNLFTEMLEAGTLHSLYYILLGACVCLSTVTALAGTCCRSTSNSKKDRTDLPPRCTEKYLNSPLYKGSKVWDTLPENVQRSDTLTQFIKWVFYRYAEY